MNEITKLCDIYLCVMFIAVNYNGRGEGGLKDIQMDTMIIKWEIRKIWKGPL